MLAHPEALLASVNKLHLTDAVTGRVVAEGVFTTFVAIVEFVWLPIAFCLLIRRRHRREGRSGPRTWQEAFLTRAMIAAALLTLAGVLATKSTAYHARWMQPALFMAGPLCALWLLPRVRPSGVRALRRLVIAIAALVTVALPIDLVIGIGGNPQRMSAPVETVLERLEAVFPVTRSVIVDTEWLAGNLYHARPGWEVLHMEYGAPAGVPADGSLLVWWRGGPGAVADLAGRLGIDPGALEVRAFSEPYPYKPLDFTLYVARLPAARP